MGVVVSNEFHTEIFLNAMRRHDDCADPLRKANIEVALWYWDAFEDRGRYGPANSPVYTEAYAPGMGLGPWGLQ